MVRNDRLFAANLKALAPYLPEHLVAAFEKSAPARVLLSGSLKTGDLNALVNGAPLYTADAESAALAEVAAFQRAPDRITLPLSDWETPHKKDYSHYRFPNAMMRRMRADPALQRLTIQSPATGDGAYLIVIGLGLGLHIPLLLDRFSVRNLLIVESDPELIFWSMHLVDWRQVLDKIGRRGGELVIGPMADPSISASQLVGSLRGKDFALVDRSLIYRHGEGAAGRALAAAIHETAPILHGTIGFFEDEISMMRHAVDNAENLSHRRLVPALPAPPGLPPAVIVGSGPSLEGKIEILERLSKSAVVFGAGTGSSALLRQGSAPHIHCEVENDSYYASVFSEDPWRPAYANLPLIAPYVVDPRQPRMFAETILYHRELLVPSRILTGSQDVVYGTTPTVANLACRTAVALGFRTLYLFGVDLGTRVQERIHTKNSFYDDAEEWRDLPPLNLPVEANFGGAAWTNKEFLAARAALQQFLAANPDLEVWNCSDGAAIHGATPLDPAAATPPALETDPADILQDRIEKLPLHEAGRSEPARAAGAYKSAVIAQFAAIRAELDKPDDIAAPGPHIGGPISALHDRLRPLVLGGHLDPAHTLEAAVRTTFTGTVLAALQFGRFFEMRMGSDQVAPFMRHFRESLADELTRLEADFRALF